MRDHLASVSVRLILGIRICWLLILVRIYASVIMLSRLVISIPLQISFRWFKCFNNMTEISILRSSSWFGILENFNVFKYMRYKICWFVISSLSLLILSEHKYSFCSPSNQINILFTLPTFSFLIFWSKHCFLDEIILVYIYVVMHSIGAALFCKKNLLSISESKLWLRMVTAGWAVRDKRID